MLCGLHLEKAERKAKSVRSETGKKALSRVIKEGCNIDKGRRKKRAKAIVLNVPLSAENFRAASDIVFTARK